MAKSNKLTSSILLQEQSKLFVQRKVIVTLNKKDYEVLVDQVFIPTKLNALIMESISNYDNLKDLDESVKVSYLMLLAIKTFTNVEIAKTDDFQTQIKVLNAMLDLEIFDKIIGEFPESELEKINDYMLKFNSRIDQFINDGKSIEYLKEVFGGVGLVDGEVGEIVDEIDDSVIDINEDNVIGYLDSLIVDDTVVNEIDEINNVGIEITDPE